MEGLVVPTLRVAIFHRQQHGRNTPRERERGPAEGAGRQCHQYVPDEGFTGAMDQHQRRRRRNQVQSEETKAAGDQSTTDVHERY